VQVVAAFYLALADHDKRGALEAIGRVPSVVLTGDRDRLVALRLSEELAEAIPGAEFIQVPRAGHVLILERPELVNDVIIALVATALTRAGARRRPA
jgi:pimeloyl-ACP methyl ester carboxylesterase